LYNGIPIIACELNGISLMKTMLPYD
jgi:hypothetical protein